MTTTTAETTAGTTAESGGTGTTTTTTGAPRGGTATTIFPSPIVYDALFASGLLDRLPTDKRRGGQRPEPERVLEVEPPRSVEFVAQTRRLGLRPPTWDELRLLNQRDALGARPRAIRRAA